MNKKIILITTIHNRAHYLRACLDSALGSTLDKKHWIHLLIDNASTDGATEIAQEYCDKWEHIYLVRNKENVGQMPAYNFALDWVQEKFPSVKYLAMCDSDDRMAKAALEVCYDVFEKNKQIDISYSDFNMIGKGGEILIKKHPKSKRFVPVKIELTDAGQKMYRIRQINPKSGNIATHFRFIRLNSFIDKMKAFSEEYPYSTDFSIYTQALDVGMRLAKIDQVLYHWRSHKKGKGKSTGQVEKDHGEQQRDDYLTLRTFYENKWKKEGRI